MLPGFLKGHELLKLKRAYSVPENWQGDLTGEKLHNKRSKFILSLLINICIYSFSKINEVLVFVSASYFVFSRWFEHIYGLFFVS